MANWIDLLRDAPNPSDIGGAFTQGQAQAQALRSAQLADQQKRQAVTDQQQYRSRVQTLLAGGDVRGAAAQAAVYGDDKAATNFIALQKNQYDQGATGAGAMGEVVRGIASLPYEQRRDALAAAAPTLQAMGYGQDQISTFDPTDANLAAVGGLGYSATQRAGDQQAQFNGNTARQAENFKETQPIVIDHDAFDPITGELRFRAQNTQVLSPGSTLYSNGTAEGGGLPGTGGSGYDVVLGNGQFGQPPAPLSQMTVGAVVDFGRKTLIPATRNNSQLGLAGTGKGSSAVGRYQITSGTLMRYAPRVLGADWQNKPFDAAAQDKLGEAIFNDSKGGDLSKVWTSLTPAQARQVAQMPWAQARDVIARGESGGSAPTRTAGGALYTAPQTAAQQAAAAKAAGRPIPQGATKDYQKEVDQYRSLTNAVGTFKDGFGGNMAGGIENLAQGVYSGIGTEGQRDWWAGFRSTDNVIRNGLFGSALTEHEKQAYEATTISPSMDPKEIRLNLVRRQGIIKDAVARKQRFLAAQGFSREAIVDLAGEDLGGIGSGGSSGGNGGARGTREQAQALLRSNPALRAQYEARYGAGSAAAVLGR